MERGRLSTAVAEQPPLVTRLRSMVWGPAEFVGLPPLRMMVKGVLVGGSAAVACIGSTVAGAWYGNASLAAGEGGFGCAALLVTYLLRLGAGRALVGVVGVLAVCLALQAPQAAAGFVLAERGRAETGVVTAVDGGSAEAEDSDRYLCSVTDKDGVPVEVRIWRGCEASTRPGDTITVVSDVKGLVPPRGAGGGGSAAQALEGLAGWSAGLLLTCVAAVVRSCRLSTPGSLSNPS
ncbi:hypothetical protein AB0L74_27195 [Streptomyces sp. NPDC052020]|uniref:hypothetical protein n=1 Tax=Streptomyces sp. NPDC052020 TaxID=3155677 RepID=UPI003420756E